jgi:hypothetical protein
MPLQKERKGKVFKLHQNEWTQKVTTAAAKCNNQGSKSKAKARQGINA